MIEAGLAFLTVGGIVIILSIITLAALLSYITKWERDNPPKLSGTDINTVEDFIQWAASSVGHYRDDAIATIDLNQVTAKQHAAAMGSVAYGHPAGIRGSRDWLLDASVRR